MSIIHNKNLNTLLNLLINCISAKFSPQILPINSKCTFLFLNFLIIGLCNSSDNSLLEVISFLITDLFASVAAPLEVFYQKIYKPLKQVHIYPSYFGFLAILNALLCNTLSATVLLVKSLKSP